ncbi:nucleoside triphosphate pyrophosphohydrolase [Oceanibacterium hippocampi]|uniref:Nucleoside triphosphate pyrophosphohydrolase n=1 Tax=Oceanibacterium hippocampi TaxID=745714 RepID=A0A1Y5T389_9PROT|nr:nucleoside triphosphate pyrophosphohydrolase [Oceanibacterium hippocampi]SLN54736.1 Nucleoside triphosphate pyrophosphohydrolase [Oceanibacterium hippocampi]
MTEQRPISDPSPIHRLLAIMARLRDPDGGCPWDLEQDFHTIAPHTIEEAYEVAEAIADGDMAALRDELGDLLFQVVFYAQMASENGDFDFDAVAAAISDKMIARHPHVFGDGDIASASAQTVAWEEQKARERAAKAGAEGREPSALDGVSRTLPGLTRAVKLQNRAGRVGFDWPDAKPVIAKIREELDELEAAMEGGERNDIAEEYGDLLFVVANLARHIKVEPEEVLRQANRKFERRFRGVEERLRARGRTPGESDLDEMDALWNAVKAAERA